MSLPRNTSGMIDCTRIYDSFSVLACDAQHAFDRRLPIIEKELMRDPRQIHELVECLDEARNFKKLASTLDVASHPLFQGFFFLLIVLFAIHASCPIRLMVHGVEYWDSFGFKLFKSKSGGGLGPRPLISIQTKF